MATAWYTDGANDEVGWMCVRACVQRNEHLPIGEFKCQKLRVCEARYVILNLHVVGILVPMGEKWRTHKAYMYGESN